MTETSEHILIQLNKMKCAKCYDKLCYYFYYHCFSPSFVFPSVIFLVDCVQMSNINSNKKIYDLFYLFITGFLSLSLSVFVCVRGLSSHHSSFSNSILWRKEYCLSVCVCKNETSILSLDDNLCEIASFEIRWREEK